MRKLVKLLAIVAASAISSMLAGTVQAESSSVATLSEAALASQVLDLINTQRVQHGCAPLQMDDRLSAAAERQSLAMATGHFAGHMSPDGGTMEDRVEAAGYNFGQVSENIQVNTFQPAAVVEASLNAPRHRDNLLNCTYTDTGIAVALQSDATAVPGVPTIYKYYWTQVLAVPAVPDDTAVTAKVLALINAERAKQGCGPLQVDAKLSQAAARESHDMVTKHFFSHTEPDGTTPGARVKDTGYNYQMIGENIEVNTDAPQDAVTAWMNSPGHRANILTCAFRETGIAVAVQDDNIPVDGVPHAYKAYWTQVFAMPFRGGS